MCKITDQELLAVKNRVCPICGAAFIITRRNRNKKYCSTQCASIARYGKIERHSHCVTCGQVLYTSRDPRKKFCSKSCSAKYNNSQRIHDEATKERISSSLRRHAIQNEALTTYPWTPVSFGTCTICGRSFANKGSKPRKTCSDQCLHELSKIQGVKAGKASAAKRVLRSKDEVALFDLCTTHFDTVLSNYIIKDGWDADIVLPNHHVAILWNGPWHYKQLNMSNHSLKQVQTRDRIKKDVLERAGYTVLIFEDRSYTPETAFDEIKRAVA